MEYYPAIKRNYLLIHGTTQMALKCIMKPDSKETRLKKICSIGFLLYTCNILEKAKAIGLENRSAVARGWGWKEKLTSKGHERILGVITLYSILIVVVVTQLYAFGKLHCTVHTKKVNFIICKL